MQEHLKTLLDTFSKIPSRDEFVQAFKAATDLIKRELSRIEAKIDQRLAQVRDGKDGLDGKDGKDGARGPQGERGPQGLPGFAVFGAKGADGKDGKDGSPDTPEQVRDKLETLKDDERLDVSAVKGLEALKQEIEQLRASVASIPRGMRKVPIVKRVSLTSQVDGNTRTFTLPKDTVEILGLWGTSFPITFDSADWTLSGNQVTLATAIPTPDSGQTLVALVETLFY